MSAEFLGGILLGACVVGLIWFVKGSGTTIHNFNQVVNQGDDGQGEWVEATEVDEDEDDDWWKHGKAAPGYNPSAN